MSGAISGFISGGLSSNSCFVAGTAILTSAGYVAIETIQAGDKVYAHNPDTGETALKEVVQTFVNEADELIHITVNGEEIITTNEHPFYVPVKGWTAACQLRAGDRLQLVNGEYVIVEQIQHEILESPIKVYNFEVEDFHTYYVGEQSVLVHNLCTKFKSLNQNNYRHNALKYNNSDGKKLFAHHVFPQQFREEFAKRGINIDSPIYIKLLNQQQHTAIHSAGYNSMWKKFFIDNPFARYADIMKFAGLS